MISPCYCLPCQSGRYIEENMSTKVPHPNGLEHRISHIPTVAWLGDIPVSNGHHSRNIEVFSALISA